MKTLRLTLVLSYWLFNAISCFGQNNIWYELGRGGNCISPGGNVAAMAVDSQGNVYVGGSLKNSLVQPIIQKWDGNTWSTLPAGSFIDDGLNSIVTDRQ